MKFCDEMGNVQTRFVDRPEIVSTFFDNSNAVDRHNQVRQFELKLEKKWLTENPYFRLVTTLIGISVTDTWKLAGHHKILTRHSSKDLPINLFGGILCKQLLQYASKIELMEKMEINVTHGVDHQDIMSGISTATTDISTTQYESSVKIRKRKFEGWIIEQPELIYLDKNNEEHSLCKFAKTEGTTGKRYRKARMCREPGCK